VTEPIDQDACLSGDIRVSTGIERADEIGQAAHACRCTGLQAKDELRARRFLSLHESSREKRSVVQAAFAFA